MKTALILSVLVGFGVASSLGCSSTRGAARGETTGEYLDDATTTTQVKALIVKDPDAQFLKIDVSTKRGQVLLQGTVNSRRTEDRLASRIKDINGVKSVRSLLVVSEAN